MAKWLNPNDAVDTRGWGDFDIIKDQGLNHKTIVMPQGTFPTVDMNLTKTLEEFEKTALHLKTEFEIKDLGKTSLCLDLK
ncbi:hypothetical protein ACFX11_023055 [Malus domestica]